MSVLPAAGTAAIAVTAGLVAPDPLASAVRTVLGYATLSVLLAIVAGVGALALVANLARRRLPRVPAAERAREAWISLVDRTPWFAAVAAVAAAAWAVWYSLSRGSTVPRIFSDELIHATAARRFSEDGSLSTAYGPLTPIVHSLGYLLTGDDITAYHLIQAMNVTLMTLAAFPAYLLARRALAHKNALIIAALTVVVPWIVYARFVMTEGVFYPVFLLFALALVRALERPTLGRQAALVLAVAAAFSARTQAVLLPAAVAAATLLYGVAGGHFKKTVWTFWPTWITYALAATGVAGLAAAGVWNPLGAYDVLLHDSWRHPRGLMIWAGSNLTSLTLGLGVLAVPAAALGAVAMLKRQSSVSERALAAAAISSTAAVLVPVVVLSTSPYGQGTVHERSLFYVAPLILISAMAWTTHDYTRSKLATTATMAIVIAMMLAMPRGLITAHSVDALSFKLWTQLGSDSFHAWLQMLLAVVAGTCVVALLRSSRALILTIVLAAIGIAAASDYRSTGSRSLVSNYGWVDRALAGDSAKSGDTRATILWIGCPNDSCSSDERNSGLQKMALYTEFFNSRVARVGHLSYDNTARGLSSDPFGLRQDGVVTSAGVPLRPGFVVTDARVEIVGNRIALLQARDVGESELPNAALSLWRVPGTLRVVDAPTSRASSNS